MQIYELSEKLCLMPTLDEVTVRVVGSDGSTKEFPLNLVNVKRDYENKKTYVEVKM